MQLSPYLDSTPCLFSFKLLVLGDHKYKLAAAIHKLAAATHRLTAARRNPAAVIRKPAATDRRRTYYAQKVQLNHCGESASGI